MKLKSHLKEADLSVLVSIARFWGIADGDEALLENHDNLVHYLYPRMQTESNFKTAFDALGSSEREMVYFLALHGGSLPQDEFRRRMKLEDDERFATVFNQLNERGFFWMESVCDQKITHDLIGIPEPFVRLVDLPPYWRGFLGYYLQELGINDLKMIARQALDFRFGGRKKQVILHHLRNHLLDPGVLRATIERHPPIEQELFQQIMRKNGASVWRDLLDGGAQKKFNHAKAEHLENLTHNSGLVYVWRAGTNKYNNMVMAPRDLSHIIQNGFRRDERTLEELSHTGDRTAGSSRGSSGMHPNVILDNSNSILRDLTIFLAYVSTHSVKMLNNGGVGRNDQKKIVGLLSHNKTPKYVSFLALFAMSRKLLISVGEEWRVSKNVGAWLQDARQAYVDLFEFWLETNEWNEEYPDGDVVHVDHYPQNLMGTTELRKLILRVLQKVPVDSWIEFETFADSLLPQVAIEIPGRYDHTPAEKDNRHTLLILESMIAESLYWLGLITLGASDLEVARELGSRPNESVAPFDPGHLLSAHLMNGGEYSFSFKPSNQMREVFDGKYLEPRRVLSKDPSQGLPFGGDTGFLTIQPNLEIVVPPDFGLEQFFSLLKFTEVKKVDIMTTLVLTRESLLVGMEEGWTEQKTLKFLADHSRRELPETVVDLIADCSARHGEVDLGHAGGYIATSDSLHVEEIRSNPRLHRYVKDVFHETLIILNRSADLKKIARELEKLGFLPHVSSETLHVTGEGLFHVTLRPEELYECIALLQFAQGLEEDFGPMFEDRIRSLLELLSHDVREDLSPGYYIDPLLKSFQKNFEKAMTRQKDEEKKKLKKQVNRLLNKMPAAAEAKKFTGENPCTSPREIIKMIKFAIETETQVKIHYLRSTGDEIDEVIEPESLKGTQLYAYCHENKEHHMYSIKRIQEAAI